MLTLHEAAAELLRRRTARNRLGDYIRYTKPDFHTSAFSETLCDALDKFVADMIAGTRPILIIKAPPQHGKSEIVSRKLPAYLISKYPDWKIATASYAESLAIEMATDVRRTLIADEHLRLFPATGKKTAYARNTSTKFTSPYGNGSYVGVGVEGGLTGRGYQIGIIDDPIKGSTEALSATTKEKIWNWYQSVFINRASSHSGQIIMATSWADDDLASRVEAMYEGNPRLTVLKFPAINSPDETGYNPDLPLGALVPELHPIEQLLEFKASQSDYWWSALFQQCPKPIGGNVFKDEGVRYYLPKDLPAKFDKVLASWDCTFKDTDGTDYVVGQVWGKSGANSYLLDQVRERMSFTKTVDAVVAMRVKWPMIREVLIEDKANGPAVIDTLKGKVHGIIPIEPDGSKLARAHAVTSVWEAGNVWIPHPEIAPWVKALVTELTTFPAAPHDDQVDSLTQALRRLYPLFNRISISKAALANAARK